MSAAIDAVHAKLQADGFTAVQLERLHRELPAQGQRNKHEVNVAIAISMAYRDQFKPIYAGLTCRALAAEIRRRVGNDGRYIAAHGEPVDLLSSRLDVATRELEERLDCDFFELWEGAGGDVDRDGDTDAYTRHMVAEVAQRCESTNGRCCAHSPQW